MVRENLDGFPDIPLPDGYRFRSYRDGDAQTWTYLHVAAEPYFEVTSALFEREFGATLDALPDRMYFVETVLEDPVGSITAWWKQDEAGQDERGMIHWVVVHPGHQGRGIARAMMTRAMQRLRVSYSRAMLGTSTGRLGAIKVYLDFGFVPDAAGLKDPNIRLAWTEVQERLSHPALAWALVESE